MLLKICELTLTVLSNLLVFLNKKKDKDGEKKETGNVNLGDVLKELMSIEEERKRFNSVDMADKEQFKVELRDLNNRLKNIEAVLYEKRTSLLKDKIIDNNSKEKGG